MVLFQYTNGKNGTALLKNRIEKEMSAIWKPFKCKSALRINKNSK
jgi:hypothetical protein